MPEETQPESEMTLEDAMAAGEERINRLDWASRSVMAGLTLAVIAFVLATGASEPWQFLVYPLAVAVPLALGTVSSRYLRNMHVDLLRSYQARLLLRAIELEKMASHDELTQLYNRRHFYDSIQEWLARARVKKQTFAVLVLDIDGLKQINDEYGHAVGDIMIANLGRVIAKHTRGDDIPARLGGDEFAILMPNTDKRGAYALAQRLWQELEEVPMYQHEGIQLMLNVSIGVSGFPWGGEDVDELMHWADADMYANKVSRRLPQPAASGVEQNAPDDFALEGFDRI